MVDKSIEPKGNRSIMEEHFIPARGKIALKVKKGLTIQAIGLEGQ